MLKTSTLMLAALGLLLSATTSHAVTTITDCTMAPVTVVNKKTVVNLPAEDVVIQCALMSLPGSDQTQVTAKSIVVDGPNGGSVSSSGKGGQATLLKASGDITIDAASVSAEDSNGNAVVMAGGNVAVTAGSLLKAGDNVEVSCTGALCTIDVDASAIVGNKVSIIGDGTVTISPASTITTSCPRDEIKIVSNSGDVVLGGGTLGAVGTICCNSVQAVCSANPNDAACPFAGGGSITLNNLQELVGFCADCLQGPNVFKTCVEGNLIISAPLGSIDLSNVVAMVGESILINALLDVNMSGANISNCGKKTGVFVVTSSTCNVASATLLDDDPELMPTLNCAQSGVATLLGTCPASP